MEPPLSEPVEGSGTVLEVASEHATLAETELAKFFNAAAKHGASDLLLRGNQPPRLRLRGGLKSLDVEPMGEEKFEQQVLKGLTEHQREYLASHGSVDLAFEIKGGNRFRVNIFRSRGRLALAARTVSNEILNFEELYLPPVMKQIAELQQGLVLLCGVTGSGKSTTIASMLNYINHNRACHIVTIEDPVEYLFTDAKAMINQREVGIDVPSFTVALRALVRENPDVVLIGEMRDRDTFEAALQASETGHLVFGTIHASSASQAFGRIYDLFPAEERDAIRNLLAYQMQAFVYQKLLKTVRDDVPRVPAVEVLLNSPAARKYIVEGREHELNEVIKKSKESGMLTFTDSLVKLVDDNFIHPKVAQQAALNPDELKMRLRGIS